MVEEFNKVLKTSSKECIQNAVQQGNGCGHSALVVVIPRAHFITSIQTKLDTSKLGGVRTSKDDIIESHKKQGHMTCMHVSV